MKITDVSVTMFNWNSRLAKGLGLSVATGSWGW